MPASWTQPILTAQYTGLGVVRLLEAVRRAVPHCRILQAGSSELFAGADRSPQDEEIPIRPLNPYGIAKAFAYHTMRAYRAQYRMFATNALFYTNESLRRSPEFLFRKVTRGVAEIVAGRTDHLSLGNLETIRDWGYAPEYAALAIAMLDLREAERLRGGDRRRPHRARSRLAGLRAGGPRLGEARPRRHDPGPAQRTGPHHRQQRQAQADAGDGRRWSVSRRS